MRTSVVAATLGLALLLVAGCATEPTPVATAKPAAAKPKAAAAAPKPTPTPAPAPQAPVLSPTTPTALAVPAAPVMKPKLSPEAAALVDRLTNGGDEETLPHEIADSTGFPGAIKSLQPGAAAPRVDITDTSPQPPPRGLTADGNSTYLVERDWTGLVLVPISKSLSKAHTTDVRLAKVEAHPLTDGRVRIWTRVQNVGNQDLPAEIACEFRLRGVHLTSPYFYDLDVPANGYRDVFFVSPDGELNSYTVLVRSADAVQH